MLAGYRVASTLLATGGEAGEVGAGWVLANGLDREAGGCTWFRCLQEGGGKAPSPRVSGVLGWRPDSRGPNKPGLTTQRSR